MKKSNLTRNAMRSVFATAMALTLAMPTTLCMAAEEDSVLSQALKTYDFEDGTESLNRELEKRLKLEDGKPVIENGEYALTDVDAELPEVIEDDERGNVLEFKNFVKVDKYVKTQADAEAAAKAEGTTVSDAALNKTYVVGEPIQQQEKLGGRVKLDNPYKGMEFDETDENAGVSISYWVKVPVVQVDDDNQLITDGSTGTARGANSTTVVFNNTGRTVLNKDDMMKHLACQAYDEAVKNNDTEALKDYDMGTKKIVKDENGNAYVLYQDYGKLLRFNPNYPDKAASGQAAEAVAGTTGKAMKGGWYAPKDSSKGKITVTDDEGNTYKICSFQNEGSTTEDSNQYELFAYLYAEEDDKENGYSSKSKVREGVIDGSLQISTDNDFGFNEDNFRQETYVDDKGENRTKAVDGARVTNPNSDKYGKIERFRQYNQFYFDGDEFVTDAETAAEEWHYVTVVIQNDWVVTYVDGVEADPESDYKYCKDIKGGNASEHDFGLRNAEKLFNKGKGLRAPFGINQVDEWSTDGTASTSPANSVGLSLLEWISLEGTELYLGGTSYAAEPLNQSYGTVEGVCLDDVSFFDTALTSDEAIALYEEVSAGSGTLGDVDGDGSVALNDAKLALQAALKITTLEPEQEKVADVDGNGSVELADAQKILKVALKIEAGF